MSTDAPQERSPADAQAGRAKAAAKRQETFEGVHAVSSLHQLAGHAPQVSWVLGVLGGGNSKRSTELRIHANHFASPQMLAAGVWVRRVLHEQIDAAHRSSLNRLRLVGPLQGFVGAVVVADRTQVLIGRRDFVPVNRIDQDWLCLPAVGKVFVQPDADNNAPDDCGHGAAGNDSQITRLAVHLTLLVSGSTRPRIVGRRHAQQFGLQRSAVGHCERQHFGVPLLHLAAEAVRCAQEAAGQPVQRSGVDVVQAALQGDQGGGDVGEGGHGSGRLRRFGDLGRAGLADQLGPDAVPVVGPQMPAHDSAAGSGFDGGAVVNGYTPFAPVGDRLHAGTTSCGQSRQTARGFGRSGQCCAHALHSTLFV